MKNNQRFEFYVSQYKDMLYKLAYAYLKSEADSNDVIQNVFLNFYKTKKEFESEEHMKYFLVRCTINECKKVWRAPWSRLVSFEEASAENAEESNIDLDLLNSIMALDRNYRLVIVLFYIEGYRINEIARILNVPVGTVGSRLSKAKEKLKKDLKGEIANE
ncbi:MAG: sigma-70 family RNA polymerase sigma factor [Clostridia bacterium]|nr:sigma-70 family RNA polymerase sigma factor [Clostridia bacterium]